MLVLHGTLENGCVLVAGEAWGKVRTMMDWSGQIMKQAPPSIPVLTAGWRELPIVGEKCLQVSFSNYLFKEIYSFVHQGQRRVSS